MPRRTIAIGDIHGCAKALAATIQAIEPTEGDLIVPLGDSWIVGRKVAR